MSMHSSNRDKALQHFKILEEYQVDSLNDTSTNLNDHPKNSNNNNFSSTDPTVSVVEPTKQIANSQSGGSWYSVIVNEAWDAVQKSVETSDQALTTAWKRAESLGTAATGNIDTMNMMSAQSHHSQSSSTNLVFPQSKDARLNSMKQQQQQQQQQLSSANKPVQKSRSKPSPEMRQPAQVRGEALKAGGDSSKRMEPEETSVQKIKKKTKPVAKKTPVTVIDKERKEADAYKRAAVAKQRGAQNSGIISSSSEKLNKKTQKVVNNKTQKTISSGTVKKAVAGKSITATSATSSRKIISGSPKAVVKAVDGGKSVSASTASSRKVSSDSVKAADGGKSVAASTASSRKLSGDSVKAADDGDKSVKVSTSSSRKFIDGNRSVAASTTSSRKASSSSVKAGGGTTHGKNNKDAGGPKAKKINAEPPGTRQDPPGAARKSANDDATVASARGRNIKKVPITMKQKEMGQQPKSIKRQDLEDTTKKASMLALSMLPCTGIGAQQRVASPIPIRPCDVPRGPEIKQKHESILEGLQGGDFFSDALKAFGF